MTTTDNAGVGNKLDADLQPGTRVGEYVICDRIGVGGFGTVYRAEHPLIGKEVAIKVLGLKLSADPEMVSRFVAEARSVNQIQSKYIIDIFGFGELEDHRQYYIMELLDGMPLDEYLDDSGCVNLAEAVPILRGIGKALDAAHRNGVAHRDLKPENVYLVRDEQGGFRPKLLDFGIAKLLGENDTMHKTRTGAPMGTPLYMSPEQCRGKGVDHRTDIYAFGCMSYRMLTGQVPFDGDGYMDILFKQIQAEPTPPTEVNPTLPAGIDGAIAAMMSKDPAARPETLAAAVKTLEEAASAGGVTVPPGTVSATFTPLPSTGARRPIASGVAATVAATPGLTPRAAGAGEAATGMGPAPSVASVTAAGEREPRNWVPMALAAVLLAAGALAFVVVRGGGDKTSADAAGDRDAETTAALAVDAAPAPEPTTPAARPPTLMTLEITGVPTDTEVFWGAKGQIGIAPGKIQFPRGDEPLNIMLKALGHQATSVEFVPDDDKTLELELELALEDEPEPPKTQKGSRGKKGGRTKKKSDGQSGLPKNTKNSIEDPFAK